MTAALALTDSTRLVASWRTGVLSLPDDRIPCPGMIWREAGEKGRAGVWRWVRRAMLDFLDEWGEAAADFGWSTESLFGVHHDPRVGAMRSDCTGALVTTYSRRVIAMCEREITLERRGSIQTYRGLVNPAESVPIWQISR